MSCLCQIALIDDESQFMECLSRYNRPPSGYEGFGSFYGDVPPIGSTLQIDWRDYELENKVPFPEGYEQDRERVSNYFKVIHVHRHLIPKPEYYNSLSTTGDVERALNTGHHSVAICVIYVVQKTGEEIAET
ncbi:MAG TPA: hypothetical protein V6D33_13660 [Cyanophyceae cyanobacterium]